MSALMASWSKAFVDFAFYPARDVMASMVTFFRLYASPAKHNATSAVHSEEMTANDLQFYFLFKFFWSILMAVLILLVFGVCLHKLYKLFFVPYERIRRLGSIG